MNLSRSMFPAMCTADPTLAIVIEPPCRGAGGKVLSPSTNRTRDIGTPSASAATWVMDVYVPGPMSIVALRTSKVPSALA